MEKHVISTLEQAEMGDRESIFEMGERFYEGRGVFLRIMRWHWAGFGRQPILVTISRHKPIWV
jgi:hypothetical protein